MSKAIPSKKIKKPPATATAVTGKKKAAVSPCTAAAFIKKLQSIASPKEAAKTQRYFKSGAGQYGEGDVFIGVRMGALFKLAAVFNDMPVTEIEKLLESPFMKCGPGR